MFSLFTSKTKLDEIKVAWEGIVRNVQRKEEKTESLNKYLKDFTKIFKDEIKNPDKVAPQVISYIMTNDLLPQISKFCMDYPDRTDFVMDYFSLMIHEAKYSNEIINDNKKLIDSIIELILHMEKKLKQDTIKFRYKNSFAFFLNEVTRLLLINPTLINSFKLIRKDELTGMMTTDYIIFSNLLRLLQIDTYITNYEYKKYVRRSLIVCLSFDEIATSYYLENDSGLIEILVDKLCNYYQMLPSSFDLIEACPTYEAGINMNKSFHCLIDVYFDFKDYMFFLNKMCNSLSSHSLKDTFKYYFFNKFYINNVQNKLLSNNQKVIRSNFQYIISILHDVNNTEIIDVTAYFLFGFNDQKTARQFNSQDLFPSINFEEKKNVDDLGFNLENNNMNTVYNELVEFGVDLNNTYDYAHHLVSQISLKILNSMINKNENLNVIISELFEIFFVKRPYMMIHKFIKPYVDFCIKQKKIKQTVNAVKSYPTIDALYNLVGIYQKYDDSNLPQNIESNMYKNYSYYMNYDIDFYCYYLAEKQKMDDMEMKSVNMKQNDIDDGALLEESINISSEKMKNKVNSLIKEKNNNKTIRQQVRIEEAIVLEDKLFDEVEETEQEFQNMNFLFMKNIQQQLSNYLNNTNIENIFLTNLILTILSVPCLNFDPDLVECNSVLLDPDVTSKYSLLTVVRFLTQEINKLITSDLNFDKFLPRRIQEIKIEDLISQKKGMSKAKSAPIQKISQFENSSLEKEYQEKKIDYTNYYVFFEFVKEFVSTISHKHKFEGLVEDIYGFYSNLLDDYYNNEDSNQNSILKN